MRKFVCLLACGWGILGLSSCQDTQLAEQLDGTWHTSFTQKDEDGIPYTEEEDVKFIYMKSNAKDGGKFKEKVTIGTATEYYTVNESYKIVCTISGEWEIIGGDLYMGYDLSSLDVKVKDLCSDKYQIMEDMTAAVVLVKSTRNAQAAAAAAPAE